MKKYFYLLCAFIIISNLAKAAPGDTTWVQANMTNLTGYGHYDSTVNFPAPGTSYRKIYMIFTLGKYMCPGYNPAMPGTGTGGTGWCGDWDYTVQNYLMTPGGDTLELGRFITPYANADDPRTPWAATQTYIYDVTDYSALLTNTGTMRIFFSGYSGGFTANLKFAFIEGTPERNVMGVKMLWTGSYGYGGTTDISTHFSTLTETAPAGTETTDLKFTVTGHGADAMGCCEFAAHNYQVMLNGSSIATQLIWRDNCGLNELYPQSGTWIYNRGNWCPGAMVYPNFHLLPGITAGSSYNIALQFDPYTGGGSYTTEASVIYYGGLNKNLDASIEQIIAPTNDDNHYRENPLAGKPTISVRNSGRTPITSILFQYYVDSTNPAYYSSYTWTGNLDTMQDINIDLDESWFLREASGVAGFHNFGVKIIQVNGTVDDDSTNNVMTSTFLSAPKWPTTFRVFFKTNSETDASGNCETFWQIRDIFDNVVAQRVNAAINTLYIDTVTLGPAPYKLQIFDTVNCDGLQWWGMAYDTPVPTTGSFTIKKLNIGTSIPMSNYNYGGTYNNDFGCGFTQYFTTNFPAAVTNVAGNSLGIEAYPNPAQNTVNVDISGVQNVKGEIKIIDMLGRVALTTNCTSAEQQINIEPLVNGVYTILFVDQATGNKLTARLIITK